MHYLHGVPPVFWVEGVEVKGVRGVVMGDGGESQSIGPRGREVTDVDARISARLLLAPRQQRRLDGGCGVSGRGRRERLRPRDVAVCGKLVGWREAREGCELV